MGIELRFNDGPQRAVDMTDDAVMASYMNGTHKWNPQPSSTAAEVHYGNDSAGFIQTYLYGSFSYSNGAPVSGIVTGVLEYPDSGAWKFSLTGLPSVTYNPATWDTWTRFKSVIDLGVSVYGTGSADTLRGGLAGDLIYGNAKGDAILGADGSDTLHGGGGDDTLDPGTGLSNLMYGESGNDTFIVRANVDDHALESVDSGDDTVRYGGSTTSPGGNPWDVPPNIEHVVTFHYLAPGHEADPAPVHVVYGSAQTTTFVGCEDQDLFYTTPFNNPVSMSGRGGPDQLTGSMLNDTLDGGSGDDVMYGRDGDDTYVVDSPGDLPREWYDMAGFTSGVDTIRTHIDYVLPYSLTGVIGVSPPQGIFENLELLSGARKGTGNLLANAIEGSDAPNVLRGLGGADTLDGKRGSDVLDGGQGRDFLRGGSGDDSFFYDSHDALISGGPGVDSCRLRDDGAMVDLTAADGVALQGVERIDLTVGDHILVVDEAAVVALSDTDSMRIDGDAGDTVELSADYGYDSISGSPYAGYLTLTSTTTSAVLYVDLDIVIVQDLVVLPVG